MAVVGAAPLVLPLPVEGRFERDGLLRDGEQLTVALHELDPGVDRFADPVEGVANGVEGGASSPLTATSRTRANTAALVPNRTYTVRAPTPATSAIAASVAF